MTGNIIMIVLALMALIGIGNIAVKDFRLPSIVLAVLFGLIAGLNFIPQIELEGFAFSVGTGLLFLSALLLWLFKGKTKNKLICLLITVVLSGLTYGAMRLAEYYGNTVWSQMNYYYPLIVGFLAFLAARNAKYGYLSAVLSIGIATVLSQIGKGINLDAAYSPAIIAGTMAIVLYCVVVKLMPTRPSKASYYFEATRMSDQA